MYYKRNEKNKNRRNTNFTGTDLGLFLSMD